MKTIESSARGFILTGNLSYLESYRAAILREGRDAKDIATLMVDNRGQQRRLPDLENLAMRKIQSAETSFQVCRTNGLEAAVAALPSLRGQQIMDEFEQKVQGVEFEEMCLLALRDAEAKRQMGLTKAILILGNLLGLLIRGGGWLECHT